ncbi:MAG: insulinase family protein, partial [Gemmatimonadota bacterium]|nr:insulinase family protein [Gemmatimonadota bacterium]
MNTMHRTLKNASAIAILTATWAVVPVQAQFPTEPPPPTPLRPLQLPPFQETTLGNGLAVIVVEDHRLPVVSVSLTMPAGSSYDPDGKEGLADLLSDVISKGTETRTAEEI